MVQLFPSTNLEVSPPSEGSREKIKENGLLGSPKRGSSGGLTIQPLNLEASTVYHEYDAYIENGLICLRHKVRNLEKKKVSGEEQVVVDVGLQPVATSVPTAQTRRL